MCNSDGGSLTRSRRNLAPVLLTRALVTLVAFVVASLLGLTPEHAGATAPQNYSFDLQWGSFGSGPGQFWNPVDIFVHSSGEIYVTDYNNHRIQVFDASGNFVRSLGSFGSAAGQFNHPEHTEEDSLGNLYVADADNQRIQKVTPNGQFLTAWTVGGYARGLALDSADNVYVANWSNDVVMKFTSGGQLVGLLGVALSRPEDVAVDSNDNVYVIHGGGIAKFSPSGAQLPSFTGSFNFAPASSSIRRTTSSSPIRETTGSKSLIRPAICWRQSMRRAQAPAS